MSNGYHMDDEVQLRAYSAPLMARLLAYVRPHRAWMVLSVVLLIVVAILSNLNPVLIMWTVDGYINSPERTALAAEAGLDSAAEDRIRSENLRGLGFMVLILGAILFMQAVLRYGQLVIVGVIGQVTMMRMRMGLFEHLQRMSLRFLDHNPVGRLMTRVTNDVEKIQQTIVTGVVQVASDMLTIFVVLAFMFAINWKLSLIALIPVPLIAVVSFVFRHYAQRSFLEIRRRLAHLNAYMQENVSGMRVIQIFGRQEANFAEYDRRNVAHRDEWLRQVRNFAVYFPSVEFLGAFSIALIVLFCGWRILEVGVENASSGDASVGTMFAFVFLTERFFGPIRSLADRYNLLLEAMASSERVFQLLDHPEDIADPREATRCEAITGGIEFKDVWFAYEAAAEAEEEEAEAGEEPNWVLKGIDLSIRPGERVAVVGHTGAGKSTLINLLNRFYDVQRGAICVDGVDVRDYAQASLRRRIGMVLQDVFLFASSVEENIRLGDEDMASERIRACAEHVNAARFIEKLPGKYAYEVGERGCNLSTGQRQLLAFARTLAHKPDVLVLDEATSNIDTETEALIQDAIAKLMAERTSIVIAHRLSTVQHADRIVVMHHGEIREQGTHQELLAYGGLYRTLYELQYKEQGKAPD